jgi:hypothetical protein
MNHNPGRIILCVDTLGAAIQTPSGASPRHDYVLDVSRPPQSTPRWRRIAISWIHAILLAELTAVVIALLGLAVDGAVRGIVEIVSGLGRTLFR